MPEQIRSIKITVEVDTNKQTHKRVFDDMDEAREWLESITADLS